jgi:uncharacterized protein YcbX
VTSAYFSFLSQIFIFPVKSLRASEVERAKISPHGFLYDRTFMLLKVHRDGTDGSISGLENMHVSKFPRMALFLASLAFESEGDAAQLDVVVVTYTKPAHAVSSDSSKDKSSDQISFPLLPPVEALEQIAVTMHNSPTLAYKMDDKYSLWFSERLGHEVFLAYLGDNSRAVLGNLPNNTEANQQTVGSSIFNSLRSFLPSSSKQDDTRIAFQDCAQLLVVTEESLDEVSARLPKDEPMDITKFRPNIVVSGSPRPWAEDYWAKMSIGDSIVASLTANCARCRSIDVDYATGEPAVGESGKVLKKLQIDRRIDSGAKYNPCFGRYGFYRKDDVGKVVSVGDLVMITKENDERTTFCKYP